MRPLFYSQKWDITIARPFLGVPKNFFRKVCRERSLPYVEDPSNSNTNTFRGFVRPKIESDECDLLAKQSLIVTRLMDDIKRDAAAFLENHCGGDRRWGYRVFLREEFLKLPTAVAVRVLAHMTVLVGDADMEIMSPALYRALDVIKSGEGSTSARKILVTVHGGKVWVSRQVQLSALYNRLVGILRVGEWQTIGEWRVRVWRKRGAERDEVPPLYVRLLNVRSDGKVRRPSTVPRTAPSTVLQTLPVLCDQEALILGPTIAALGTNRPPHNVGEEYLLEAELTQNQIRDLHNASSTQQFM